MAIGAAATRLKWPMPRVTSRGLHANSRPAIHDSAALRVTCRASRNVQ
jgi:hypothetical protein